MNVVSGLEKVEKILFLIIVLLRVLFYCVVTVWTYFVYTGLWNKTDVVLSLGLITTINLSE